MPRGREIKFNVNGDWLRQEYETKRRRNADLCIEIGCSPPTLLRCLRRFGIAPRDDRVGAIHESKRAQFNIELARNLYEGGANSKDIGDVFGINHSTVLRRLRSHGVKIRHHNDTKRGRQSSGRISLNKKIISEAYGRLGTIRAVCKELGLSIPVVSREIRRHSIKVFRDRTGKNNPNWREHITAIERNKRRNAALHAKWRDVVYARDKYTCQRCGDSRGKNLNAHHIEAHCENKIDRFNPDNGVTLCIHCHRGFHRKYGLRRFGRNELQEYLAS